MFSPAAEQVDRASLLIKDLSSLQTSLLETGDSTRQEMIAKARALISTLEAPMESILWMGWAEPARTATIRISIDIGLFEKLAADDGKAKNSQQLADATKTDSALIGRMLKHLASMFIIRETLQDTYAPTPLSNALTDQIFYDGVIFTFDAQLPSHARLPAYLRSTNHIIPTDGSVFKYSHKSELGIFEWIAADPRMQTAFQNHMAGYSMGRPHWMDDGFYPVTERLRGVGEGEVLIVDVGGATGHDLAEFHDKAPTISGRLILQDQAQAISSIREGDRPGIECTVHDFFTPQPVRGAKAYYMHSVLHDWSDDNARKILTQLKEALKPGHSKILINENVVSDQDADWKITSLDWTMMVCLGSCERTETQWRDLVVSVGLKISGIWKGEGATESLIEIVLADDA
ncbi:hypothetical protein HO133_009049 [Letharia lupina]|uniref:O-methyltransferase domain-containing protein n=1 Tax=Letharia lupina TaxID=560253 RepID=A0A8H6CMG9_9LECA|nr:uncharacterized protein HO133_009049 [Letharia lupina]KAF6226183.1 hypothetical protein HO133_009049 [Letharia lupina]